MSTAITTTHFFIIRQINIYAASILFVAGIIGDILNVVVFLSLKTFRQSSCVFYLTIMCLFNIGDLLFNALSLVIKSIYGSDGSETSLFYCKIQYYVITTSTTISLTCFCLATIDQYCATCSRPRFQQWCRIQLAKRIVVCIIVFWILHATPYLFLFNHTISPITGAPICTMTNIIYIYYRLYVIVLVFFGILPSSVSILFGVMAYRNLKGMAHYTIPLIRRELDKQLTTMVLTQVVITSLAIIPFTIVYLIQLQTTTITDPDFQIHIQFAYSISSLMTLVYNSCPLYVYISVSQRFRRQLIYVLIRNPFNHFRRPQLMLNNQVLPNT